MTTHTPTFDFNLREIQKKTLGKDRSFEPDFNLHQALSELKMKLRIPDSNSALHNKKRELEKISKKINSIIDFLEPIDLSSLIYISSEDGFATIQDLLDKTNNQTDSEHKLLIHQLSDLQQAINNISQNQMGIRPQKQGLLREIIRLLIPIFESATSTQATMPSIDNPSEYLCFVEAVLPLFIEDMKKIKKTTVLNQIRQTLV